MPYTTCGVSILVFSLLLFAKGSLRGKGRGVRGSGEQKGSLWQCSPSVEVQIWLLTFLMSATAVRVGCLQAERRCRKLCGCCSAQRGECLFSLSAWGWSGSCSGSCALGTAKGRHGMDVPFLWAPWQGTMGALGVSEGAWGQPAKGCRSPWP